MLSGLKVSGALVASLAAALAWSGSAAAVSLSRAEVDEVRAHDHALVLAPGRDSELRRAGGMRIANLLPVWRLPSRAAVRLAPLAEHVVADRFLPTAAHFSSGDPRLPEQWWIDQVGASGVEPPGPGVPVTVIDTGIDVTHPEFSGRPATTLLNNQQVIGPTEEHGTAVASVIAAPANGQGVVGVYPQAALQVWDASPAGPGILSSDVVAGIDAAARRGRGVINLSLGSPLRDPLLELFIAAAFRNGTLVVAASGNERGRGSPLSFPASYPHVLTVGALDQTGRSAAFSSGSPYVDVAAPGQGIPVAVPLTVNPTGYAYYSGTSFSAPLVAGASAWVWTARPALHITQLFEVMRASARDIELAGFDAFTGFGRLDIPRALTARPLAPDPQEPNEDIAYVKPGGFFRGGWPALNSRRRLRATLRARPRRSGPLDGSRRVGNGQPGRLRIRLAHADADARDRKAFGDRIGDRGCEGLDQLEVAAVGDFLNAARDLSVVDGILDLVRQSCLRDLEHDVVEERPAVAALMV